MQRQNADYWREKYHESLQKLSELENLTEEQAEILETLLSGYNFKGNEIPDSDLYDEQHKTISCTLGDLRKAKRILHKAKGTT